MNATRNLSEGKNAWLGISSLPVTGRPLFTLAVAVLLWCPISGKGDAGRSIPTSVLMKMPLRFEPINGMTDAPNGFSGRGLEHGLLPVAYDFVCSSPCRPKIASACSPRICPAPGAGRGWIPQCNCSSSVQTPQPA